MTPGELQFLSSHLGHDVATHKNKYRLHSAAVEITKVGKLLLAIDGGDTRYCGRRMNEILCGDDESVDNQCTTPTADSQRGKSADYQLDGEYADPLTRM